MEDNADTQPSHRSPETVAAVVEMRDAGASWLEVQQRWNVSRQQARHLYQIGKREERRRNRS